jgi:hypothetical protein
MLQRKGELYRSVRLNLLRMNVDTKMTHNSWFSNLKALPPFPGRLCWVFYAFLVVSIQIELYILIN